MGIPNFGAQWRKNLRPASYSGITFFVSVDAKTSGRRLVPHEFPKKNIPYTEDMGRRVRRFPVTGYIMYSPVFNPDYQTVRDQLIAALEADGPGQLVLPTGLQNMNDEPVALVEVETYSVVEHVEKGGYCEFDMLFVEAGINNFSSGANTQAAVSAAASAAVSTFPQSSDIGGVPSLFALGGI